jgi:dATP pyrophosphohydrolase
VDELAAQQEPPASLDPMSCPGSPGSEADGETVGPGTPPVYKRPQSVLVVIFTRGGEFLMLRRTSPRAFWQSVTGSLAPGESPRNAALREVREETGLDAGSALIDLKRSVLFPIVRAWRERYAPNVRFNREYWFALVLETRRLIRLNRQEHLEYRWLPAPRAAALASSWTNRDLIRALAAV